MTLVSVITPTWQRHGLLFDRCMVSVRAQTWPKVEHVIVSDGPDVPLAAAMVGQGVVFDELPEHCEHPQNVGSLARNRGLKLATGELVAYLDDDNAFRPGHVELLAKALLDNPEADFAYSRMQVQGAHVVGAAPPAVGQIDSSLIMHRRSAVGRFGLWPPPSVYAIDWAFVEGWLRRGARWVFVGEVSVDYWMK